MSNPMTGQPISILLVDDIPILLEMLKEMLTLKGYHVVAVESGTSAYTALTQSQTKFDIVFTDVQMPDMSGITLAEKIYEFDPTLPVLLATGDDDLDVSLPANVKAVILKPYKPKEIAQHINNLLGG